MKIAVLGSGSWGTALSLLLMDNGHQVTLWCHNKEKAPTLRATRENPSLPGAALPPAMEVTGDLALALAGAAVVVTSVPSYAVGETAREMAPLLEKGAVVVSTSKGFERGSGLRLSQVMEQALGKDNPVAILSGPSHAEEVAQRMPTACVAASPHQEVAELVQDTFMNEHFRVYTNPDIVGVELGAAMKNVYALCCGVCDGLGYGDNTKALLMTRGLTEMARLGAAMGGRSNTFAGLTGVGDLIVTCTSMHSRNRRAGILIGQGMKPLEAMDQIGAVVEGYYAAENAYALAQRMNVDMPIAKAAYQVLCQGQDIQKVTVELMNREKKHELESFWI